MSSGSELGQPESVEWIQIPEGVTHLVVSKQSSSVYLFNKATMTDSDSRNAATMTDEKTHPKDASVQTETAAVAATASTQYYEVFSATGTEDISSSTSSDVVLNLPSQKSRATVDGEQRQVAISSDSEAPMTATSSSDQEPRLDVRVQMHASFK